MSEKVKFAREAAGGDERAASLKMCNKLWKKSIACGSGLRLAALVYGCPHATLLLLQGGFVVVVGGRKGEDDMEGR